MPTDRPEFYDVLGLAPPITVEDIKQAFLEKVKTVHPDRGGDAAAFRQLQEARDQAMQYANFRSDRMKWLGV
jgi:curved DNA-binding protein CbpA